MSEVRATVRRTKRLSVALLCALVVSAGAIAATGSASAKGPTLSAQVTNGPCIAPSASYCLYRLGLTGTFQIKRFAVEKGALVAQGVVVDGVVRAYPYETMLPYGQRLTLPVVDITASCAAATLTLAGSEPPSFEKQIWEPLPAVFSFRYVYRLPGSPPTTANGAVGLLPTTAAIQERKRLCTLTALTAHGASPKLLAAALNALLAS